MNDAEHNFCISYLRYVITDMRSDYGVSREEVDALWKEAMNE